MSDDDQPGERLNRELAEMRLRLAALETSENELRRVQEALRRERNRAQEYLNIAGVILVALDQHGAITLLNRKGHEILGYQEGQLLGRNWFDACIPAHDRERVRGAFRQMMDGDLAPAEYFENPVQTRSGDERTVAWHNTLLVGEAGNRAGTLSSGQDITERRRAEAALRKMHEELERQVEARTAELALANEQLQAVDGLLVADVETKRFLRANSSMCRMLGYSDEELLSLSIEDIHPPEGLAGALANFEAQARGEMAIGESISIKRRDGSVFYADIVTNRLIYHHRPCLIGFFRDITERKRAQEALQQERRTLEHMLRSSDHERQLIAYEIHDELAQQLTAAIMQFQSFDHLKARQPAEAARAYEAGLAMLRQSHFEARRLISGLRPPILDESGILAAIAHLTCEQRGRSEPKIELHSDVQFGKLAPTLENAIYRIVQEALANACKHSGSEKVRVGLAQRGDRLRIEIEDWGVGFEASRVGENCFGLEGIRERARLLGGQATVESAPGQGTRIIVELPLIPPE